MFDEEKMSLEEKAENLITFARNSNVNDLDKVVKAVVNLVQEQRLEVLEELITKLKLDNYETIVSQGQRQETAKLFKR